MDRGGNVDVRSRTPDCLFCVRIRIREVFFPPASLLRFNPSATPRTILVRDFSRARIYTREKYAREKGKESGKRWKEEEGEKKRDDETSRGWKDAREELPPK